jgi:hypothetical protein
MNDAQRYRRNAVECLSAAERCGPDYRGLTLAIGEAWLLLARHEQAMDGLLAIWTEAHSGELSKVTDPRQQPPDAAIAWAAARRRGGGKARVATRLPVRCRSRRGHRLTRPSN